MPSSSGVPPAPTFAEDVDGEEVYRIYRPADSIDERSDADDLVEANR